MREKRDSDVSFLSALFVEFQFGSVSLQYGERCIYLWSLRHVITQGPPLWGPRCGWFFLNFSSATPSAVASVVFTKPGRGMGENLIFNYNIYISFKGKIQFTPLKFASLTRTIHELWNPTFYPLNFQNFTFYLLNFQKKKNSIKSYILPPWTFKILHFTPKLSKEKNLYYY